MCIAVSKQHPIADKNSITLDVLNGEKFIERVKCGFWNNVHELFKEKKIYPHKVMQAENDEFVLSLVAENLGVSIITDRVTPYDVNFIPIEDFKIEQYIGIVISSTNPSVHVQTFLDTITNQYKM
jgi:DNA-binding transcriptional LysR family regulator